MRFSVSDGKSLYGRESALHWKNQGSNLWFGFVRSARFESFVRVGGGLIDW
jgi:hypothetical protein